MSWQQEGYTGSASFRATATGAVIVTIIAAVSSGVVGRRYGSGAELWCSKQWGGARVIVMAIAIVMDTDTVTVS